MREAKQLVNKTQRADAGSSTRQEQHMAEPECNVALSRLKA